MDDDNSFKLFTIPFINGPIPVHIHQYYFYFIILSVFSGLYNSPLYALNSILLSGPILFLSVFVHELSHAYVSIYSGGTINKIVLRPMAGMPNESYFSDASSKTDIFVAIAGPVAHLPLGCLWMFLMGFFNNGVIDPYWEVEWGRDFFISLLSGAISIQIFLFLINLIPAYPLDGGKFLEYFKFNELQRAKISSIIAGTIGWFLLNDAMNTITHKNVTFLRGWNELYLGTFMLYNCHRLWETAITSAHTMHVN